MTDSELQQMGLAGDYNPAALKSKTYDHEELLYREKLKRSFILWWLTLGNLVLLIAGLAVLFFVKFSAPVWVFVIASSVVAISVTGTTVWFYFKHLDVRELELKLRKLRQLAREYQLEEAKKVLDGDGSDSSDNAGAVLLAQKRYREDIPEVIDSFRRESNKNRRMSNLFQNIIIIGSLFASSATTSSVYYEPARWLAVVVSLLVAVAAGFIAYYKYRERSFNLQQAADSIERNYLSVELRAGRYASAKDDKVAYQMFVDEVEMLREEQNKRQQQLEQPAEVKDEQRA